MGTDVYLPQKVKDNKKHGSFHEVSCMLTEKGVIDMQRGTPGSVEFDFSTAWKIKPANLLLIHTHPQGMDELSKIDHNMLQGWTLAFTIPITAIVLTRGKTFANVYIAWRVLTEHWIIRYGYIMPSQCTFLESLLKTSYDSGEFSDFHSVFFPAVDRDRVQMPMVDYHTIMGNVTPNVYGMMRSIENKVEYGRFIR